MTTSNIPAWIASHLCRVMQVSSAIVRFGPEQWQRVEAPKRWGWRGSVEVDLSAHKWWLTLEFEDVSDMLRAMIKTGAIRMAN